MILEHENGALSTLNASYASASEYYLMNIYGKDATAFYDLFGGLRVLRRGEDKASRGDGRRGTTRSSRSWRNGRRRAAARASPRSAANTPPSCSRLCAREFCRRARADGSRWRRFYETTEPNQKRGRT